MSEMLKIRDFIYLDVERVKSIFSQIEEGLLESSIEEKGDNKKLSAKSEVAGGIINVLRGKVGLDSEWIWENKESETKTLHDYMYNILEEKLKENEIIYIIDGDSSEVEEKWINGEFSSLISDTSFVLIKGKVMIDDYIRLGEIASNFNEIGSAIDFMVNPQKMPNNSTKKKKVEQGRKKRLKSEGLALDENFVQSLSLIIKKFLRNPFIIKVLPFKDSLFLRFIGNLNGNFLREDMDSIVLKYGTCPVSDWWIFGQISSIFPKDYDPVLKDEKYDKLMEAIQILNSVNQDNLDEIAEAFEKIKEMELEKEIEIMKNSGMELSLENLFNAFRNVDATFSPKFPSITFTPIAVYRENI